MIYSSIVKKRIRQSFDQVNNHDWDVAHDVDRTQRPSPLPRRTTPSAVSATISDTLATLVRAPRARAAQPPAARSTRSGSKAGHGTPPCSCSGTAAATLLNGGPYTQHAIHVITLRWGKIHALDVFEDSQAVARALDDASRSRARRGRRRPDRELSST